MAGREFRAAPFGAPSGPLAKNDNGYIVYFSDRRNNKNAAAVPVETGEYGFEDVTNPTAAGGAANGVMDGAGCLASHVVGEPFNCVEDFNDNHILDIYGRTARAPRALNAAWPAWPVTLTNPCLPAPGWVGVGWPNPLRSTALVTDTLTDASIGRGLPQQAVARFKSLRCQRAGHGHDGWPNWKALVARANRTLFFRRALKIVNGRLGNLPNGLTIASENPVYVQGNYNSDGDFVTAGNVPAAIIADAVTLLSNNWNDLRSFNSPTNSTQSPRDHHGLSDGGRRRARVFRSRSRPARTPASGPTAAPTTSCEASRTGINGATHRYRGSMVSFFINRQAVGTFKCCDQDVYNRGRPATGLRHRLPVAGALPPGTPMFRDVNTLTFRQLLRPTQ